MSNINTPFSDVYSSFLAKVTDDMYMELSPSDTEAILKELLRAAVPKFEFPRVNLFVDDWTAADSFNEGLSQEEINILATYMVVEWLSQQLATVENVRLKYSSSDFKFTSQANHMHKILQLKKEYQREGFHLQRLYKRRTMDSSGKYHSTIGSIMDTSNRF